MFGESMTFVLFLELNRVKGHMQTPSRCVMDPGSFVLCQLI